MESFRNFGAVYMVAIGIMAGCGDDSGAGGSGAEGSGGAADGGGNTGGQATGDGGSNAVIGALTHCEPSAFHCNGNGSFYACAEYAQADAASYEPLCVDGGGTWAAGYCDETGAIGACLPLNYCMGMGIGFLYDAAQLADAQESCSSTGGTWEEPTP
jgi:hypothetical protein